MAQWAGVSCHESGDPGSIPIRGRFYFPISIKATKKAKKNKQILPTVLGTFWRETNNAPLKRPRHNMTLQPWWPGKPDESGVVWTGFNKSFSACFAIKFLSHFALGWQVCGSISNMVTQPSGWRCKYDLTLPVPSADDPTALLYSQGGYAKGFKDGPYTWWAKSTAGPPSLIHTCRLRLSMEVFLWFKKMFCENSVLPVMCIVGLTYSYSPG